MPGPLTCSVVIPVLDDAAALDRCLRAIRRQRVQPDEVLVVDNGSEDRSAAVAVRHGATLLHEARRGIAAAAASGYDAATGEVILRLDADSRPPADWTARVLHRFAMDGALDALTGRGRFVAVPPLLRRPLTGWYWRSYFGDVGDRIGAAPLFGSNFAMRADAWRAARDVVHRDDPDVHDDLDLSIALVDAGRRLRLDPDLVVGVSSRPLLHPFGLLRRARMASHTLAVHGRAPVAGSGAIRALLRGAGAGLVATVAMSAWMVALERAGVLPGQPPRKVVDRLAPRLDDGTADLVAAVSHLAYGAAAGALLPRSFRGRAATGAAYGAALWGAGYEGWVPAIGVQPPAHRDDPRRVAAMLSAHLLYGAVAARLGRS